VLLINFCRRAGTSWISVDTTDVQLYAHEFDRFAALTVQVMIWERVE
jgi:hypothetical protein